MTHVWIFQPLPQWYDSTHVASTDYYCNFVFSAEVKRVASGGFIEDMLGQTAIHAAIDRDQVSMLKDCSQCVSRWCAVGNDSNSPRCQCFD